MATLEKRIRLIEEKLLYSGFFRAKVVSANIDNNDYGAVKVFVPDIMTDVDPNYSETSLEDEWDRGIIAYPANNPLGGRNNLDKKMESYYQGTVYVPALGSWVWVFFEKCNPNRCFYLTGVDIENTKLPAENRLKPEKGGQSLTPDQLNDRQELEKAIWNNALGRKLSAKQEEMLKLSESEIEQLYPDGPGRLLQLSEEINKYKGENAQYPMEEAPREPPLPKEYQQETGGASLEQPHRAYTIIKTHDGRAIVVVDSPDMQRVEITGKKRRLYSEDPSGDVESAYQIDKNMTTILLDEREGKEKVLIRSHQGDFIHFDIDERQLQIGFMNDIIIKTMGTLHLSAAKDMVLHCDGDFHQFVGGKLVLSCSGNYEKRVSKDDHSEISGNKYITTAGSQHLKAGASIHMQAGQKITKQSGMALKAKTGKPKEPSSPQGGRET